MSIDLTTEFIKQNLWVSAPVWSLAAAAALVLLVGAFRPRSTHSLLPALGLIGVIVSGCVTVHASQIATAPLGMQSIDSFTVVFDLIILIATAIGIIISSPYVNRESLARGEYYALMMFSSSGAMLMGASDNFIMMFLGLELLSIPLYVLSGFRRLEGISQEAALKYFLLGSFASAFFVYGTALVFAATGTTSIAAALAANSGAMLTMGVGMVLVALGFKVALVPFHMWTPDVYEGAPTSVTAFMSVVAKAAGFGGLARIVAPGLSPNWHLLLWLLAAGTMIWGNLIAIPQQNIKRLLAYSSISHAGYILMGLLTLSRDSVAGVDGMSAVLFYLLVYTLMNFGAFAVVIVFAGSGDKAEDIDDYRGIARRSPLLAALMSVFLLSLAGIPPFAGFFGKLFLFSAAVQAGYPGLAVIAVLTSVMGVFYYLRVTVVMFMEEEPASGVADKPSVSASPTYGFVLGALAALVIVVGILAAPVLNWTAGGAESLTAGRPAASASVR